MPLKNVSPEDAKRILAPFIGQEIEMLPVSKKDGGDGYFPADSSRHLRENMRDAAHAQEMILQLHIDKAVIVTFPQRSNGVQRKTNETLSVHAYVVQCRDGKFRISHRADAEPEYKKKTTTELSRSFHAGNKKDIIVKRPLSVKKRPSPRP